MTTSLNLDPMKLENQSTPVLRHVNNGPESVSLQDIRYVGDNTPNGSGIPGPGLDDSMPSISTLTIAETDIGTIATSVPMHEGADVTLMYAKHEKIAMKDFSSEVRAFMDVENFLKSAVLLLDVDESSSGKIIKRMLERLFAFDKTFDDHLREEAMESIFTHDRVHLPGRTIQSTSASDGGGYDYDQSWMCIMCSLPSILRRQVAIARLKYPVNMGRTSQEIQLIILILAPMKEKGTKNALETGRTFATIFADMELRQQLLDAPLEEDFKNLIWQRAKELVENQPSVMRKMSICLPNTLPDIEPAIKPKAPRCGCCKRCFFGRELAKDFKRRIKFYLSDFSDGVKGHKTPQKLISTILFLYFACLLPSMAFGILNYNNTNGFMDIKKVIFSQTIGGIFFSLVGGQPLIVLLTTAPLALYTKVIFTIASTFEIDFFAMFTCVGLWNCFFLIVYSFVGASKLMKWSTRSTEEIFALFITIAFIVDAVKDIVKNFDKNYVPGCNTTITNGTVVPLEVCNREVSLLFLLLALGTLWLGVYLFNFTKTPFLNANKREILADYALPVAVITMSFFGSFVFKDITLDPFKVPAQEMFVLSPLHKLSWGAILASAGLGFSLSLLFFMDQNISAALINSPSNRLKKGSADHWDLMIVAIINIFLSLFGLPWVHAALPHSPLHVRALADMEERVDQGHVYQIVIRVRETRLTTLISHIMIGLSLLMIPIPLKYIPIAVFDGLFLYVAITALNGNQLFERITLLFTEQSAYPPNHYIRRVPQRKIHQFTLSQLLQLAVLCAFGFSPIPYMKMVFPIIIMLMLPLRHMLTPKLISHKYLKALDGHIF